MAESKFPVSVVIGAVDNVTYKVMEINQKLEKLTAPLGKLKTAFGDLGRESGLNKLGSAIGNVGTKGAALFGELKGAALGVVGVMATIGVAFNKLVLGAANSGEAIKDASDRLGIGTTAFQKWQFAASQSGIEADKVENILTKFSKAIGDAALGSGEGLHVFRGMGIALKDASGKARSMEQILPELADKFKSIQDPALRNAIAMRLFGREGAKMGNLLMKGSAGIKALGDEADRLGLVIGEDKINQADQFKDSWDKLILSVTRARDAFGAELFPVMIELFEKLSTLIAENRPQIIAFAKAFATELPGILVTIKDLFVGLWGAVKPLIAAFQFLSSIFGTTNTVLATMSVIIGGKLIIALASFVGSLWTLGSAVLPVLVSGFGLLWPILQAIGAFLLTTPLGWVIMLATVGTLLYKNWEPFRNLIDGIWEKIKLVTGKIGGIFGFGGEEKAATTNQPLGPALGATATVAAGNGVLRTENQISVNFDNVPKGIRVQTDKAEAPINLNLGYSMAGGL